MQSNKLTPGQTAPDFSLPSAQGGTTQLSHELQHASAVVVLFICNHCPYVQAYIPRLVALQKEFADKARFIAICSNDQETYPEDSFEHMKQAAVDWKLNFPYLHDEDQSVARAYGAQRTPEIFLLDAGGICRYEGGVDDCYQDEAKVKDRPLRDALVQVIHGRAVARPQTWAIGCSIKWKDA